MSTALTRSSLTLALAGLAALALGCEATKIRLHMRDGNRLYNAQKYEEAAAEYESILAIDPDHWEANYRTAISYMALFHPGSIHPKDATYAARAIEAFEKTLSLPPPDAESTEKVRGYYLGLLTTANRTDKAVTYLEEQLRQQPDDDALMIQLGSLYARRGEYNKAAELYEKRANAKPQDKVAWYGLGVLCWEHSHRGASQLTIPEREAVVARGIAALERAIQLDANYFDALSYINLLYREKGNYLGEMGRLDEAQAAFATADDYRSRALAVRDEAGATASAGGA
jgi:tetratricopeptide (TPR) repeat protein